MFANINVFTLLYDVNIGLCVIFALFFLFLLYFCATFKLKYEKYSQDIVYAEKILSAQNNRNMELLTQYAKEKTTNGIEGSKNDTIIYFPISLKMILTIVTYKRNKFFNKIYPFSNSILLGCCMLLFM